MIQVEKKTKLDSEIMLFKVDVTYMEICFYIPSLTSAEPFESCGFSSGVISDDFSKTFGC